MACEADGGLILFRLIALALRQSRQCRVEPSAMSFSSSVLPWAESLTCSFFCDRRGYADVKVTAESADVAERHLWPFTGKARRERKGAESRRADAQTGPL